MAYRFEANHLPTTLCCKMTLLGKKLFIKLHLDLLFISINRTSQYGSVPNHLKKLRTLKKIIRPTQQTLKKKYFKVCWYCRYQSTLKKKLCRVWSKNLFTPIYFLTYYGENWKCLASSFFLNNYALFLQQSLPFFLLSRL